MSANTICVPLKGLLNPRWVCSHVRSYIAIRAGFIVRMMYWFESEYLQLKNCEMSIQKLTLSLLSWPVWVQTQSVFTWKDYGRFTVGSCSSAGCVHPHCPSLPGSAHASLCLTSPAAIAHQVANSGCLTLHLRVTSSNKQWFKSIKSGVLWSWFFLLQMIALLCRYSEFDRIDYVDMKPFPGHLCGVTCLNVCLTEFGAGVSHNLTFYLFKKDSWLTLGLLRRQNNRPSLYQ